MKLYHDIDMNNHKIKNIAPATSPTDLLMKQSLIIHPIILHGTVRADKYFAINGTNLTLKNPYITSIYLFPGNKFPSAIDSLTISYTIGNTPKTIGFNFMHSPRPPRNNFVTFNINKQIKGSVTGIHTEKANNIPFKLAYLPITFK